MVISCLLVVFGTLQVSTLELGVIDNMRFIFRSVVIILYTYFLLYVNKHSTFPPHTTALPGVTTNEMGWKCDLFGFTIEHNGIYT